MRYDIASPDPAGTVASLQSLGYSVEAAVADLVDNSISAGARSVRVHFGWAGRDSWVAVVDDGSGMSPSELVTAMTVAARGTASDRSATDLGRFGMGLKSASFSQASRLTVATRTREHGDAVRTWDLPVVTRSGEWRLLHGTDDRTRGLLDRLQPAPAAGCTVVWCGLRRFDVAASDTDDERTEKQFYAERARVEAHLAMVFSRFLVGRDRVRISVDDQPVVAWDPFLSEHPATERLPVEELFVRGHTVRVEAFVLPHSRKLTQEEYEAAAGPSGWLDQQGFYVYRRDRLILAGDWLGMRDLRRNERFNLVRIAVDLPAEADTDWAIDVRKSSAVPPVGMRRDLRRIGRATRERAVGVLRHRGRMAARRHSAEFTYAWRIDDHDGRIRCRINREHPLVSTVLRGSADADTVRGLFRLLEETVPVSALRIMLDTALLEDPEPFREAPPEEVEALARRIHTAMVADGSTAAEARERLASMPPFDRFDGFWRDT